MPWFTRRKDTVDSESEVTVTYQPYDIDQIVNEAELLARVEHLVTTKAEAFDFGNGEALDAWINQLAAEAEALLQDQYRRRVQWVDEFVDRAHGQITEQQVAVEHTRQQLDRLRALDRDIRRTLLDSRTAKRLRDLPDPE